MTSPIRPDSPRRVVARRFGHELERAIAQNRVSVRGLAASTGVTRTALTFYRDGVNLPSAEVAARLADFLHRPPAGARRRGGTRTRPAHTHPENGVGMRGREWPAVGPSRGKSGSGGNAASYPVNSKPLPDLYILDRSTFEYLLDCKRRAEEG